MNLVNKKQIWILSIGITLLLTSLILILCILGIMISEEYESPYDKCYEIDSCLRYKCLANESILRHETTNYLLEYQNCILENNPAVILNERI